LKFINIMDTSIIFDPNFQENFMKILSSIFMFCFLITFAFFPGCKTNTEPAPKSISKIVNHLTASLAHLSTKEINNAKSKLHIASVAPLT